MKNIRFNLLCLILVMTVTFIGCQNEEDYKESVSNQKTKVTFERLDYNNFMTNVKVANKLQEIKVVQSGFQKNRMVYDSVYDFTVLIDSAYHLQNGSYDSYTFPIIRANSDLVENLLLSKNSDGEYDSFIIEFDYTHDQYSNLSPIEIENANRRIYFITFDIKQLLTSRCLYELVCVENYVWGVIETNEGSNVGGDPIYTYGWIYEGSDCEAVWSCGGGIESDVEGGNSETSTNSGGTTYTGGGTGGGVLYVPYVMPASQLRTKNFSQSLMQNYPNLFNWLTVQDEEFQLSIFDYLESTVATDGLESNATDYPVEEINYIIQVLNEISNTVNINLDNNVPLIIPNAINEIADIEEYLKCFVLSESAVFTLYVDQPIANSNDSWAGNPFSPNVGHTFISIKQGDIRRVLGFYPKFSVNLDNPSNTSAFEDDSAHEFDVSLSFNISSTQLTELITYIEEQGSTLYDLNDYNCTDFGIISCEVVGVSLPSAFGTWGVPGIGSGGGDNPGQLGQNIRNMPIREGVVKNTSGGLALSNMGNCP